MKWLSAFLLVAVIYYVGANPLVVVRHDVSPKECARGPEYWCLDLKNAKACGAVKHCIQDVWQHMTLPKDNNEICDTCKKMVQEARDQLQTNETQEEIREVFEGTCRIYFPIKVLANECIKYVDEFIPELIEMLLSRMDPQLVCATAGLCNTEDIKQKLLRAKEEKPVFHAPTPSDCQDCKRFMEDVLSDLQDESQDELKTKLLDFCKRLPQYSEACHLLVSQNIEVIYDYLKNKANPGDICQLIGMCDETTNIARMTSLIELFLRDTATDPECDFCKQLTTYLKQILTGNSTEEEIKDMLLSFCKNMGGYEKECESFVNDNFQEIYDFLTDEIDLLCSALGICPSSRIQPMLRLTPAKPITRADNPLVLPSVESNDVNGVPLLGSQNKLVKKIVTKFPFSKSIPTLPNPEDIQLPETRLLPLAIANIGNPTTCVLCEYGLHELQNYLMSNATEESIKEAIDKLCTRLPKTVTKECVDFVNTYGDAVLALLAQQIDPSQVCTKLHICPGEELAGLNPADIQLPVSRLMPFALAVPSKATNPCETCKYVVGVAQNLIGDDKTDESVENALKTVCQNVPKSFYPKCKKLVSYYNAELKNLLKHSDPNAICGSLKLCLPDTAVTSVPIQELRMGKCDACVMIVDYLDKLIEEQPVEDEITKCLEEVCKIVPQSARTQCENLIETYGPYILQILGQLENSTQVCQAIDLCDRPAGQVHLLGGDKCTFGPAYWCKTKMHAKACKAEEHCKKFWKI